MPRCAKCGESVTLSQAYWKGDEARHRICPRRGLRRDRARLIRTVRIRWISDAEATKKARFKDPRSYVTRDGREILYGEDWNRRVRELFERDGGRCQYKPGCIGPAEHPHHVIKRSVQRDDRLTNLVSICAFHHREAHPEKQTRFTKRNRQC